LAGLRMIPHLLSFCMLATLATADPDLSKIHFFLWTRANPDAHQEVKLDLDSLLSSNFDPARPTVVLAHGWNSHGRGGRGYGDDFAPIYLEVGDYNIFSIDWGDLETWANYPQAAARTRPVGNHAAQLVALMVEAGASLADVHLVGHSLGAHVAGFVAKGVQALGLGKVARVTGLDPAKPFFEFATEEGRIDKSDGEFVDIIHTNSGNLWEGCLSIPKPLGHVDFYPAGGSHQPGCTEICFGLACANATIDDLIKGGCSHERANQYFRESIRSNAGASGTEFLASQCNSYEEWGAGICCSSEQEKSVMGEWLEPFIPSFSSQFFLSVGEEAPYANGEEGLPC